MEDVVMSLVKCYIGLVYIQKVYIYKDIFEKLEKSGDTSKKHSSGTDCDVSCFHLLYLQCQNILCNMYVSTQKVSDNKRKQDSQTQIQ